jgi:hypothetical protein
MFGEGISLLDLTLLLKAIREKNLTLQVKILDGPWEDISKNVVSVMVKTITSGQITTSNDIRLRLFDKNVQNPLVL